MIAMKTGDFEILGTSMSTLCAQKGKQTRDLDETIEVGEEIQGTELFDFPNYDSATYREPREVQSE